MIHWPPFKIMFISFTFRSSLWIITSQVYSNQFISFPTIQIHSREESHFEKLRQKLYSNQKYPWWVGTHHLIFLMPLYSWLNCNKSLPSSKIHNQPVGCASLMTFLRAEQAPKTIFINICIDKRILFSTLVLPEYLAEI